MSDYEVTLVNDNSKRQSIYLKKAQLTVSSVSLSYRSISRLPKH